MCVLEQWAIPENIHTIPRTAFRISEGEGGGGSRLWNSEGMGVRGVFTTQVGYSGINVMGGGVGGLMEPNIFHPKKYKTGHFRPKKIHELRKNN